MIHFDWTITLGSLVHALLMALIVVPCFVHLKHELMEIRKTQRILLEALIAGRKTLK